MCRHALSKEDVYFPQDIFPAGDYICRQGCHGDSFYIISHGSVRVTQETRKEGEEEAEDTVIRILNRGDYFGEQALLSGRKV